MTMLVVACPCALVLAVPTAMVAALSCAARLGILVKDVSTIESARSLTAFVFDKTGTLTTGELSVTQMGPAAGVDAAELLSAAAAVEQLSRHPVARAVVAKAARGRRAHRRAHGLRGNPRPRRARHASTAGRSWSAGAVGSPSRASGPRR